MSTTIDILDCTLRDGSYAIDFQFTAEDTALIASALESGGIRFIEVGHGLGLGAMHAGKGDQADSDAAYLKAARSVLKAAVFGAFFIPGIGREKDLWLAHECGMGFVRVGVNVTDVDSAEAAVALAKKLGLTAFVNLMKSYAVPADDFARHVRRAQEFGADAVFLVDSAGGMMPEDVRRYIEAARAACSVRLGFHGHDNLCMAVANSIEAGAAGATLLDGCLQGLGRSEGNAPTEVLAAVLQRRGIETNADVNALLDISEAFIRPLVHTQGRSGLGITAGRAKFHSSFLGRVMTAAMQFGVDPRDLILRLGERSTLEASPELVQRLAAQLAAKGTPPSARVDFASHTADVPGNFEGQVHARAKELKQQACKLKLPSVLNVVLTKYELTAVSPYVETHYGCAMSNIMVADPALLGSVLRNVDGLVDYVLLDAGDTPVPKGALTKTELLTYLDHEMWAGATVSHVTLLLGGTVSGRILAVTGAPRLAVRAAAAFAEAGAAVRLDCAVSDVGGSSELAPTLVRMPLPECVRDADAVVCLSPRCPAVSAELVGAMRPGALLYDGGIGSLGCDAVPAAEARGIRVVRVDMRPSLAAAALERIGIKHIVEAHMGREEWSGITVVAGGLIGREGDLIVDSISHPTRVIGIADGKGGILQPDPNDERVRRIRKVVAARQLNHKH